eukprot:scaffold221_cov120-Cylindrotheca_fusiformis.AAC.15
MSRKNVISVLPTTRSLFLFGDCESISATANDNRTKQSAKHTLTLQEETGNGRKEWKLDP